MLGPHVGMHRTGAYSDGGKLMPWRPGGLMGCRPTVHHPLPSSLVSAVVLKLRSKVIVNGHTCVRDGNREQFGVTLRVSQIDGAVGKSHTVPYPGQVAEQS